LAAFALGCSSPEDEAAKLVESAWRARISGDHDAFSELVVAADREWVKPSGVVFNVAGLDDATRAAMLKALQVKTTVTSKTDTAMQANASVTWLPPGSGGVVTDQHDYVVAKTDTGWKLDLGLKTRAQAAQALGNARTAIRAGRPDEAQKALASIDAEALPKSERAMITGALEATRESVESADTLAELRDVMQAHHASSDPAERANLVKKARDLGIDDLDLPDDIAALWRDASADDEVATRAVKVGEKVRVEGKAEKKGFGASIGIAVANSGDQPISGMTFVVDLIDADGVRLHQVTHSWAGPVAPGESGTTNVEVPSVPPAWEGAVNVRLSAVQ
jgi:hypothetical protein